jgi:hypothetical protein
MAEYIDRKEFIKAVKDIPMWGSVAVMFADSIPTADVAPVVHGWWETSSDRPDSLICSVCKCGFDMWKHDPHNYFPNCGVRMNGGKNDASN